MSSADLKHIPYEDFPLPVPEAEGVPVEWTPEAIAEIAHLPADEFLTKALAMLKWYVREDDVNFGLVGNEPWVAGYYLAKAFVAAQELREKAQTDASVPAAICVTS